MTPLRHGVTFVALLTLCTLCLWHCFAETLALSLRSDEYTHIALILPVCATLIWLQRNRLKSALSWEWRAALFLGLAFVFMIASKMAGTLSPDVQRALGMLSLVVLWIAAFILCFGTQAARVVLFPLGFLFWMVPFPSRFVAALVHLLQQGSTVATVLLFHVIGVLISRDGFMLSIPGLTIEVAKECSSIRSSLMLLVTSMVLAQVLLRAPWRRLAVVLTAILLSVAKNAIRIFTITMLGPRVDKGFLTGRLHHDGGVVFFGIALGAIVLVIRYLSARDQGLPNAGKEQTELAILVG